MHRRKLLRNGGMGFAAALGVSPQVGAVTRDDTDDDNADPDPIEFTGQGVTVTDEFELEAGPTLIDAGHDGTSTFDVRAVPRENGQDYSLLTYTGEFDGSTGTFMEDGTYVLYVDADGSWELHLRQPHVSENEAEEPPISIEGTGSDWIGPILFDGETHIAAMSEDESFFGVEVVPQDVDDNEFVWDGGELVFSAVGGFDGVTTIHTDGVGYVTVDAADEWTLEIE